MNADRSTRSRFRMFKSVGDRLGLVMLLLAGTEVGVLALAWQSERAVQRQQRIVERNAEEFANFGAANFVYRAGSVLANHAVGLSEIINLRGTLGDTQLLAYARLVVDSLVKCDCEAGQHVTAMVLLSADQAVLASYPERAPVLPSKTIAEMVKRDRLRPTRDFNIRLTDEGETKWVLALIRVHATTSQPLRFLMMSYDVPDIRTKVFKYIFDSRPTLLPSVFGAERQNNAIIAVRAVLPGGTVFYESPNAAGSTFTTAVPFLPDSAIQVQAVLTPAARREVLQMADDGYRGAWVWGVTLIATATIALIGLLILRTAHLTKLQRDFTTAVSHELRTPLTEIMLYAELVLAGKTSGAFSTNAATKIILGEARRLRHLVENVLVVARTDQRLLRVSVAAHDLVPIIGDTVAGFELLAKKRNVRVVTELPATLVAQCDPTAVASVLLNLLENAVRYGPLGQRVVVRGYIIDNAWIALEVDDAGPGIAVADRQRVREPYVRLERDIESATSGSGLGLAVVTALVAQMSGKLDIDASTRGGALMRVRLPVG